jgi:hypothetical protein
MEGMLEPKKTTAKQCGILSIYSLYGEHSPLVSFQAAGLTGEKKTLLYF